jgi:CheY-like chemotaxis protein
VLLSADLTPDGRLRFSVRDTGPGVAPEDRAQIFEAFVQTDPSHQAQLGGAGLGLAIVARLAAAMSGAAGVGGELGRGADFWFEAPFEVAPDPSPADLSPADLALAGRWVAIASPNAMIREAAVRQIRASGGQALSGPDVASALKGAPPEAVLLLDAALATGKGAAPRATLKPPAGRACVVLLTPDQRERIPKLKAAGFSGYLIKPLRRASLIAQVLEARAASKTRSVEAPAAPGHEDDRAAPAVAPGVRVLLAEDNPINALLARALLEREGCKVDRIASGDEAVSALSRGFYDLILMDLRMPGLNGVEATKALRERGVTTPIVALTADAFDEDRRACLKAGMNDFLAKPLTPSALRGVLSRWAQGAGAGAGWTKTPTRAKVAS